MASVLALSYEFRIRWRGASIVGVFRGKVCTMLTIQRRHTQTCPDRNHKDGANFLKCRGHCPLRIYGTVNGRRVRKSLKTRDLQRAVRRLAEREEEAYGRPRKLLSEA